MKFGTPSVIDAKSMRPFIFCTSRIFHSIQSSAISTISGIGYSIEIWNPFFDLSFQKGHINKSNFFKILLNTFVLKKRTLWDGKILYAFRAFLRDGTKHTQNFPISDWPIFHDECIQKNFEEIGFVNVMFQITDRFRQKLWITGREGSRIAVRAFLRDGTKRIQNFPISECPLFQDECIQKNFEEIGFINVTFLKR
jgi:hypothetical protein